MATVVQSGTQVVGSKSTSIAITLGAAPTSGNILAMGVAESTGVTITSVTNGMISANASELNYNAGDLMSLYYKECAGTESATTTVTFSGSTAGAVMWLCEYNGPALYQASGSTKTGTGTTVTASTEGDADSTLNIVFSAVGTASGIYVTPSGGFAIQAQKTGGPTCAGLHHLSGSSGATPTVTCPSGNWGAIHAVFKDTPAAGQEILTLRMLE